IAVDGDGDAYITGVTSSTDFPIVNAVQPVFGGGTEDAFVVKVNPAGSALVYSTYLGGGSFDIGFGIAVDADCRNAYVVGGTNSADFPITPGTFQPGYGGRVDAFVVRISEP